MIRKFLVITLVLVTAITSAQEATSSPYSFFGIGSLNFRGTVENRLMGGISIYSDSIHLNLQNPSGLASLKLVAFSVGGSHKLVNQKTQTETGKTSSTSINYLALGIPVGNKLGLSFGVLPLTAVGYDLENLSGTTLVQNSGKGGMNKVFLAGGYQVTPKLSIGVDANYNFGNIQNTTLLSQEGLDFASRESNRSNLSGFSFNLGATYIEKVFTNLNLFTSIVYTPETKLESQNFRQFASVFIPNPNLQVDVDIRDVDVANSKLTFPSQFTFGLGIGKTRNWFVGAEYTSQKTSNFNNRTFTLDNVEFSDASRYKLGGFFVPTSNSISSYWKRVTYRAGMRYEDTGLVINGEDINEFGISFGVGLPVGKLFSNVNVGFEIGKRGTVNAGLVQENFFNTFISLSLNDKWFIKTLYD
ncbi:MAG: hypothetical protein COZ75_00355 [Flavobacteriaceae bacterium CG_4_8_14_3_um_filter_34_10]|nr:hypothetical protein [Flavobacteriia bacterium]OIP51115.1 MAG: hypothetical protein AUK33_05385 [Flavobacteriaceae bacterium CG2_30_34_30]PIQ16943.1 MAG: hypothetical protein COW66_13910 [Flavobacteriaceae bacterium CG18_big_fil_WC_8_21_14_2_50_34_36]PIV51642.1 MAG: hypothetical protein COS19_00535 [Flavobacteriaceae bacterium CG02_land_8_20_14_3_00_34_13]PIX10660.1 MAG: hypothetical protein COZ75_00355 [Flavobacteriaceae bacterium CG_4_8_14_3_um_filter_34_10]PIZ07936.1 MAG: hypothetical pr